MITPGTNANHDIDAQIKEAHRELAMRRRVYWGRVSDGRMTVPEMNRNIALQQAIIDTLEQVRLWHWPAPQKDLEL